MDGSGPACPACDDGLAFAWHALLFRCNARFSGDSAVVNRFVQTEHTVPAAAEDAAVVAVGLLGALAGGKFCLPIRWLESRLPSTYDDWHEAAH